MAKTTAPLLSFGASGQIAKSMVASKWKGRPYMRRHVYPANPQTTSQTTTRQTFANGGSIWKLANDDFRAPWDLYATGQVLTGRNAFMGQFVKDNRGQADLSNMVFSPGAKGGLGPTAVTFTPGANQIQAFITNPPTPTGWTLVNQWLGVIVDDDPETMTDFLVQTQSAVLPATDPTVTGLSTGVLYDCGAWLEWTKPDGTTAYGPSFLGQATPT